MAALLLLVIPAWAQDEAARSPAAQDEAAHPPAAQDDATHSIGAPYSRDTPIETLAADPAAAAIVNKDLPGLLTDSQYPIFKRMSLKTIQEASGGDLSKTDVDKTVADLQALPAH